MIIKCSKCSWSQDIDCENPASGGGTEHCPICGADIGIMFSEDGSRKAVCQNHSAAETETNPGGSDNRLRTIVSYILPLFIILLIGLIFSFFPKGPSTSVNSGDEPKVGAGKDYYIMVSLVELDQLKNDGSKWDLGSNSAPDIYAEIYWKGNSVYRTTIKNNTFLAKWSSAEIDLRKIALTGQGVSIDDSIQAARINVKEGDQIQVKVYDHDTWSRNDPAGSITVPTTNLIVDDNEFSDKEQGLLRLTLRVVDMSQAASIFE